MNFSLLLLHMETSLTEASSVMGLTNLNTTRGLISNCRRREEEKKNKKKTAAAKHYRDLFAELEKRGIYFCE
jgi:beta-glucosidase/6-phospho-beta-glucosidase/beta-galactosidase